jgi:hypothetical protein
MLGYAHAGGFRDGPRPDIETIARYFSVPRDKLARVAALVESEDDPKILLLQNQNLDAKVGAAVLYSSTWSRPYSKFGTPYGMVHRDFHYQVMFCALAALAEVGCDRMRIDCPMPGHPWRTDAYICLLEATKNIRANMGKNLTVWLQEGEYDRAVIEAVDHGMASFALQEHRPVGISLYIFEGLNMRTVFVEKAADALQKVSGVTPSGTKGWL